MTRRGLAVPIDVETPEGKMFLHLSRQLHDRRTGRVGGRRWNRSTATSLRIRPGLDLLHDYFRGDPPLTDVHQAWKEQVRQFVRMGRLNVAGLLVSSTRNRMGLRDFRTAAADDEQGDEKARDIMRANGLKIVSRDVHDFMLSLGDSYTITQPPAKGTTTSIITAEDPRQVITDDDPLTGRPRRGLKVFRDEWDSEDHAYLYLPDGGIRLARRKGRTSIVNSPFRFDAKGWSWDDEMDQSTPGGLFPIVHFQNQHGVGEFEEHLDSLDRINDKIFNEWWTSKIQAFRQRAVKNLPETDEVTGEEIDYDGMFTASPDEMWQVPADVEFWESTPVDLGPIVLSIQKDLERLAAVTSQPLHTITPDAANGSAEGASLMREEHLYKIEDRIDRVDPRWSETMALAFAFQGDDSRADRTKIEAIWGPIERFSLGQKADAASKLDGKLPGEAIWTDVLQYAPADIPRLRTLRGRDMIFVRPSATPPARPGAPTPTPPAPAPAPAPAPDPAA